MNIPLENLDIIIGLAEGILQSCGFLLRDLLVNYNSEPSVCTILIFVNGFL